MSTNTASEDMTLWSLISDCTCQVEQSFTGQRSIRSIGHDDSFTVSPLVSLFIAVIILCKTVEYVTGKKRPKRPLWVHSKTDPHRRLTFYKQHTVNMSFETFHTILYSEILNVCSRSMKIKLLTVITSAARLYLHGVMWLISCLNIYCRFSMWCWVIFIFKLIYHNVHHNVRYKQKHNVTWLK